MKIKLTKFIYLTLTILQIFKYKKNRYKTQKKTK